MKRRISLFTAVAVCVLLFGNMFAVTVFAEQDETAIAASWAEQCSKDSCTVGTMKRALREIENPPIDEIDFMDEKQSQLFLYEIPGLIFSQHSGYGIYTLNQINNFNNIQYVEGVDDDCICVTVGLTLNGEEIYCKIPLERRITEVKNGEKEEAWDICPGSFFSYSPKLKRSDFDGIKIGDSIDEVMEIEDTRLLDNKTLTLMKATNEMTESYNNLSEMFNDGTPIMSSRKILSDGVLVIAYVWDAEESIENFKVTDIYFTDNMNDPKIDFIHQYGGQEGQNNTVLTVILIAIVSVIFVCGITVTILLRRKKATVATPGSDTAE